MYAVFSVKNHLGAGASAIADVGCCCMPKIEHGRIP